MTAASAVISVGIDVSGFANTILRAIAGITGRCFTRARWTLKTHSMINIVRTADMAATATIAGGIKVCIHTTGACAVRATVAGACRGFACA